jgi:hypothetical protein
MNCIEGRKRSDHNEILFAVYGCVRPVRPALRASNVVRISTSPAEPT